MEEAEHYFRKEPFEEMDDYAKSDAAGLNFKIELAAGVPTFSVEEGTYTEAQTITLAPGEGGEKVFYTINDGTEQRFIEPIKLEEDGTYKISAYTTKIRQDGFIRQELLILFFQRNHFLYHVDANTSFVFVFFIIHHTNLPNHIH